jgi:hypothetical protein
MARGRRCGLRVCPHRRLPCHAARLAVSGSAAAMVCRHVRRRSPVGRPPRKGGARPRAGRKLGSRNKKSTAAVKEVAQQFTEAGISVLVPLWSIRRPPA